ncbi:unnamed protein product, partial [marine sediment metagenome]
GCPACTAIREIKSMLDVLLFIESILAGDSQQPKQKPK